LRNNYVILTLLFALTCNSLWAQTFLLLDRHTSAPVAGAAIQIISNEGSFTTSDEDGAFILDQEKINSIIISHINYETFELSTLPNSGTIYMNPAQIQLDEVVVTGQYNPQSASNSLYKIKSYNLERIEAQAANTISQVLAQELNIRLNQDPALGSTGMTIQGMGGRNVKILVDGIPLVGNTGNNSDLSQINVNNIERIELVEGPMAVNYGSNALAGVVNIITRKNVTNTLDLNVDLHEESAGNEYGLKSGIHRQAIRAGYRMSDKYALTSDFARNYFGGAQGTATGRRPDWLPKTQHLGSLGLTMNPSDDYSLTLKFDFLDEVIENLAEPSSIFNPVALDEEYHTNRYVNSLQFQRPIKKGSVQVLAAYSHYRRKKTQYAHDLRTGEMILSTAEGAQDTSFFKTWSIRGSLTQALTDRISYEGGIDINMDNTSGGRIKNGEVQSIDDYAIFGSMEFRLGNFNLRPGLRYAYNTRFSAPVVPSINLKYDLSDYWSFKASYGQGFRAPSLRELYFEFVDSNHNVLGNESLQAESSDHIDVSASWQKASAGPALTVDASAFYNTIRNQIAFGQSVEDPRVTTYININEFRSAGMNLTGKLRYKRLSTTMGVGYLGTYNSLGEETEGEPLLFTPEFRTEISYNFAGIGLRSTLFYKYNGQLSQYILSTDEDGIQQAELGTIDDFHTADFTLVKSLGNNLRLTGGVRNLFNIQNVNSSVTGGSIHGGGGSVPVGYGRSYFVRVNFNLNK